MSLRSKWACLALLGLAACSTPATPQATPQPSAQGSTPANTAMPTANQAGAASPAVGATSPEKVLLSTLGAIPGRDVVQTRGLYCHVLEYQGQGPLESLLSTGLSTIRQQASAAQANAVLNVSVTSGSYHNAALSGNAAGFVICGDLAIVR